ncbi:MAG: GNAT family N-acetyltransferase [Crocinitomicaceae bacterium]|nr:GNAT family N-acetyltransferase [Crocinitomicaceae bacterium]
MELQTVSLQKSHFRDEFDCGQEILDDYLKKQANQDVKKKLSACFVISEKINDKDRVQGYYTLSNTGIPRELIPDKFQKKFPTAYKTIPATLLGRLARDKTCKGKGMGERLLVDALFRSYLASEQLGSFAVVVDPIDEMAISFYESYGFKLLPDSGKMFIPMATIKQLFT